MGTQGSRVARLARSALMVGVAGGMIATGGSSLARADVGDSGDGSGPQCLDQYYANGYAMVVAEGVEIPYDNVAGGPYATASLSSSPEAKSLAALEYEGIAGEVVLTTSGVDAGNPTQAQAYWPSTQGVTKTADQHDDGPVSHTTAYTEPTKATADARVMDVGMADQGQSGGLSLAHSDASYDGSAVKGSQVAIGYDLTLGPLHINFLRSEIDWKTDGSDAGTVATWKLEFHGLRNGSTTVYDASGDGWSFQGGSAQPGKAQRKQFNDQEQQFSQALDKAGITQADLQIQPGTVTVSAGSIDARGAGLLARLAPTATRGKTEQGGHIQLGLVWEEVHAGKGPCDSVTPPPPFTQTPPPPGPNPPKFPPDKCDRDGCKPQPFPPSGPPALPLPVPGGKQPSVPLSAGGPVSHAPLPAGPASLLERAGDAVRLLPATPVPGRPTPAATTWR